MPRKKTQVSLKGVLHFHSETGTEGGYWAFQDERFIHYKPLGLGAQPGVSVHDKADRSRRGRIERAWKADGRPLPDPVVNDAFMDLLGKNISGEVKGEEFSRRMDEIDALPTYHAEPGEKICVEVRWQDGTTEERLAETLLVQRWEYQGLYYLGNGDRLTIYEKDNPAAVRWEGVIRLKQHKLFTETIHNMWIHADMKGWNREDWAKLFFDGYPAELVPA